MKAIYSLLLVLITLQLIACGGAEERKSAYLEKADKSLQAGDLDKARIELKNVLQIDPKDARAYFKLGNVYEQKKNFSKAFGNYSKAAELSPDNSEYQAKIGRFYLIFGGDINKAREKMKFILSKNKTDVNGLLLKAGIYLKENKIDKAKEMSQHILTIYPDNLENILFLSTLYDKDMEYGNAISLLNNTAKAHPNNDEVLTVLANALYMNKNYDDAEKILKKLLNAHPNDFNKYKTLALFYQKIGKPKNAESVLDDAVAADDDDAKRKIVLVQYIKDIRGTSAAIKKAEYFIKENSKQSDVQLMLASLQLAEHNNASAISTYKRIVNDFSQEESGITARVNLAKLYMQKQDKTTASKYIEDAIAIAPNDTEVNFVKARIAIYNKDYDHAISSLRTVIKNDPSNMRAYILLADTHKANNEPDQAKAVMSNAYENNRDNLQAISQLAQYYIKIKDIPNAEKVIDNYLTLSPNNYEALSIKASILNTKKNYSDASIVAKKLISLYPDKDSGYIQSVPQLLSDKNFDASMKLLNLGYKKTNSVKILALRSQLQMANGNPTDAINALKSINEKNEDESLQLLLAKAYIDKKDFDSAEKVLLSSIEQDKTRSKSYRYLADLYLKEKLPEKCVSILNKGIIANPEDITLSATLAGFYEKTKDYDNAIDVYSSILAITPNNLVIMNNLATLLVDYKNDQKSLKRAKELADKLNGRDQSAPFMDTVGWVYYKNGDYEAAVKILKKVVASMPDFQVFNYHLGMAYYKSGDKANAKIYLKKSLYKESNFNGKDEVQSTLKLLQ